MLLTNNTGTLEEWLASHGDARRVANTGALIEQLYGRQARQDFARRVSAASTHPAFMVAGMTGGDPGKGNTTIANMFWRVTAPITSNIYDGTTMRRTTDRGAMLDYGIIQEAEATADALDREADRARTPEARQMGRALARQLRTTAELAKRNAADIGALQASLGSVSTLATGASANVKSLMQKLGPQGPDVWGTDNREGYVARYSDATPFRGGIIQTDPSSATFTAGTTAAGTFRSVGFAANPLARLRQTEACSVWADIQGPGAAQAEQQAGSLSVSFTINGVQTSQMNQIPLSTILQTLNGTPNKIGLAQVIEAADLPEFDVRVTNAIDVPAGDWFVQFYVDSGRACRQSW